MKRFSVKIASGLLFAAMLTPAATIQASSYDQNSEQELLAPAKTPTGLRFVHPELTVQAKAWKDFSAKYGEWSVELDPVTLTPALAAGYPIRLGSGEIISDDNVIAALLDFIKSNRDALKINPDEIKLSRKDFNDDRWYINFTQYKNNIEVLFSTIQFTVFKNGNLTDFRVTFYNEIEAPKAPKISFYEASKKAIDGNTQVRVKADQTLGAQETYLMPIVRENSIDFKLVYKVPVENNYEFHLNNTYIDATNGDKIWKHQIATDAEAYKVTGMIRDKDGLTENVEAPMAYQNFTVDGKTYTTNQKGEAPFNIDYSPMVTSTLEGKYAKVKSISKDDAGFTSKCTAGTPYELQWNDDNSDQFQRNTYYYATMAHDFWKKVDTNFKFLDAQFAISLEYIDLDKDVSPNASSSGLQIRYQDLQETSQQMGNCPSIFYHEYGHSVNLLFFLQKTKNSMLNGACNEATADVQSVAITNDPIMGKGYKVGVPSSMIRNLNNSYKYPDYMVGETHQDGEILGGAFGDIRTALSNDDMLKLFVKARYAIPDNKNTTTAFYLWFNEVIKADDDDGNLANGTPHAKEIVKAFTNHGIGANLMYRQNYILTAPTSVKPNKEAKITINANPNVIGTMVPDSIVFYYKVYEKTTSSSLISVKATASSDLKTYSVVFPAAPRGSYVIYYYEIFDKLTGLKIPIYTNVFSSEYFTYGVGFTQKSIETFEKNSWTTGLTGDNSTVATWTRDIPSQLTSPEFGALRLSKNATPDGQYCYASTMGTSVMGAMNELVNILPNGKTTLVSPDINMNAVDCPAIQFKYFYSANPMFYNYDKYGVYGQMPTVTVAWSTDGKNWSQLDALSPKAQWTNYFKRLTFKSGTFTGPVKFKITYQSGVDYKNRSNSAAVVMFDDFEILDTTGVIGVKEDVYVREGYSAYPNPFDGTISIEANSSSAISIYNSIGALVAIVEPTEIVGDRAKFVWNGMRNDGEAAAPGVYMFRTSGDNTITGKLIKK